MNKKDEVRKIVDGILKTIKSSKVSVDELAHELGQALGRTNCIDCTVMLCWKTKDGYMAIGSTVNPESFKCPRTKRCYTWKQVEEEKKEINRRKKVKK